MPASSATVTTSIGGVGVDIRAKTDTLDRDLAKARSSLDKFDASTGSSSKKLKEFEEASNKAAAAGRKYGDSLSAAQVSALKATAANENLSASQRELATLTLAANDALREFQAANDNTSRATKSMSEANKSANKSWAESATVTKESAVSYASTAAKALEMAGKIKLAAFVAYAGIPAFKNLVDTGVARWANTAAPALARMVPEFVKNSAAAGKAADAFGKVVETAKPFVKIEEAIGIGKLAVAFPEAAAGALIFSKAVRGVVGHEVAAGLKAIPAALGTTATAAGFAAKQTGLLSTAMGGLSFVSKIAPPILAVVTAYEALGLSIQLAAERIEKSMRLIKSATESGLSTEFIQRAQKVGKDLKISVDSITQSLEEFGKISRTKMMSFEFGTAVPDLTSDFDKRLAELQKRGHFINNIFVEVVKNARGAEERFRAVVKLLTEATKQGERQAALNLGSTFLPPDVFNRFAAMPTFLEEMVQKLDKVKEGKIISPEDVARAIDLKNRLDEAMRIITERFIPFEKQLADLGIGLKAIWVSMMEALANLLTLIGVGIEKVAEALSNLPKPLEQAILNSYKLLPLFGQMLALLGSIKDLGKGPAPGKTLLADVDPAEVLKARRDVIEGLLQRQVSPEFAARITDDMYKIYDVFRKAPREFAPFEKVMETLNKDIRGLEPLKDVLDIREAVKQFKELSGVDLQNVVGAAYEILKRYPEAVEKFDTTLTITIRKLVDAQATMAEGLLNNAKMAQSNNLLEEMAVLADDLRKKFKESLSKELVKPEEIQKAKDTLINFYEEMRKQGKPELFEDTSKLVAQVHDTTGWDREVVAIARHTAMLEANALAIDKTAKFAEAFRNELRLLERAEEKKLGATREQINIYAKLRATGMGVDEAMALAGIKLVGELAKKFKELTDRAGEAAQTAAKALSATATKVELEQSALAIRAMRARSVEEKGEIAARQKRQQLDKEIIAGTKSLADKDALVAAARTQAIEAEIIQIERARESRELASKQSVRSAQVELNSIGKSIGQQYILTTVEQTRQQLETEAAGRNEKLDRRELDRLTKRIVEVGNLKQAQAELQAVTEANFERQTMFLSDTDKQLASVAFRLRGDNWKDFMDSGLIATLRINAALKDLQEMLTASVSGFAKDIAAGTKPMDALLNQAKRLQDIFIDMAAKKVVSTALSSAFDTAAATAASTAAGPAAGATTASGIWITAGQTFNTALLTAVTEAAGILGIAIPKAAATLPVAATTTGATVTASGVAAGTGLATGGFAAAAAIYGPLALLIAAIATVTILANDSQKMEQERRRIQSYRDREIRAGLDTSTLEGALTDFDMRAAAERADLPGGGREKSWASTLSFGLFGSDKQSEESIALDRALAAERLQVQKDFAAKQLELEKQRIEKLTEQAKAARDVLSTVELSEVAERMAEIETASSELTTALTGLGQSTAEVADLVTQAVDKLRTTFVDDLISQLNAATGKGYLNDLKELIEATNQQRADAAMLGGVDMSLIDRLFKAQAQRVVDNVELMGEEFNELILAFPELADVIHEATGSIENLGRTIEEYLTGLQFGTLSTLSQAQQFGAAQSQFAAQYKLAQGKGAEAQAAQSNITNIADQFLNIAREFLGPSEQYRQIFDEVTTQLRALPGIVGAFQEGGIISNGIRGVDSVLARYAGGGSIMLAGGEYIMPAARVNPRTIPTLEAMRFGAGAGANDNGAMAAAVTRNTEELRSLRQENRTLLSTLVRLAAGGNQLAGEVVREVGGLRTDTRQNVAITEVRRQAS